MNPVLIVAAIVLGAGAAIVGFVLFQMRRMTQEMEARSQPSPAKTGADGPPQDVPQAMQELERIRRMYPGVGDPSQLPPQEREVARRALSIVRGGGQGLGPLDYVSLLLLVVGLGVLWLAPFTVFRCAAEGSGRAQCVISERLLGALSLGEQRLAHLTGATYDSHTERSDSQDSSGRRSTTKTKVEVLSLVDADGREAWRASRSLLVGASLQAVAEQIRLRIEDKSAPPFARWHIAWPALLLATLFVLIGATHLLARTGRALADRGAVSEAVARLAFSRAPGLVLLVVFATAWVVALLGGNPPEALVRWLGLAG
jgi:hypothetical protein